MGNSQSNDLPKSSSPPVTTTGSGSERRERSRVPRVSAVAVEGKHHSLPPPSHGSPSSKTPPTTTLPNNPLLASLVSTTGSASTSTSSAHAHATVSVSPRRVANHARARSSTTGSTYPPTPSHDHLLSHGHRADSATTSMGNTESKTARPPSRSATLSSPSSATQTPVRKHTPKFDSTPTPSPIQKPVDVPAPSFHDGQSEQESRVPGYSESPYAPPPSSTYSRPPRLPLPIDEEVHTPGSPILTPREGEITFVQDLPVEETLASLVYEDAEDYSTIPRKSSVLSSTTIDEEDWGDNEAFANDTQWGEVRVPTKVEWNGAGDKIFVTGTFCNWEKKVKLHRNKDRTGFSVNVSLRPGTHHIKFLVDGEMLTSTDLPTTVEWSNILVNYIEIVAPLPPKTDYKKQPPAPAEPKFVPNDILPVDKQSGPSEPPVTDPTKTQAHEAHANASSATREPVGRAEQVSEQPPVQAIPIPAQRLPQQQPEPAPSKPLPAPPKKKVPRPKYTNQVPDFLLDLDNYSNPDDMRFQRAQRVTRVLPSPPSLPMFLNKSILNGATPHKDDASVLLMPNHTVLNHLATSSIKHGVLATSGTTRYKRKFLTTIMYKPTSDDG